MKIHLCDICKISLAGETMYILDLHFYNQYAEKKPAIPVMELCPSCKEWLKECINMKRYKEEVRVQTETI